MQGSKYNDEDRERVRQMLAAGKTVPEIVKNTGIPYDTVHTWKQNLKEDENFAKLAEQRKDEFIETTTRIINKGLALMERQIGAAYDKGEVIDLSKLNTTVGTLYDKRALSQGGATQRTEVSFEGVLKKIEGDEKY